MIREYRGNDSERIDPGARGNPPQSARGAPADEPSPAHGVSAITRTAQHTPSPHHIESVWGPYAPSAIAFQRYFHLGRVPWVSSTLVVVLCAVYFGWQGGAHPSLDALMRQGAKSRALMAELGQWWRLLTANLLHVSGLHLAGNCVFLFNLGGIAEAAYRRLDYALLVLASAVGATTMSALANPSVSCGASGIVFGIWGAAAVFGVRHRHLLPERYRRVFLGNVIPYSVLALYLGVATPGIDNWGHLGGLLTGAFAAGVLPARVLAPVDPRAPLKLLSVSVLAITVAAAGLLAEGPGPLSPDRYEPLGGLIVPVPASWPRVLYGHDATRESLAFDNGAGTIIGVETRLQQHPLAVDRLARAFLEEDLAAELSGGAVHAVRLSEPHELNVAGLPARRVRAVLLTDTGTTRADYLVIARGYYRYVVSFTVPLWLAASYDPTFTAVQDQIRLTDTRELRNARMTARREGGSAAHCRLARALAHGGELSEAMHILESAADRWPQDPVVPTTHGQILLQTDGSAARGCALLRRAATLPPQSPRLVGALVDLLDGSCNGRQEAGELLDAALQRFSASRELRRRREELARP